jgi:endonuclease III
MTAWVGLASILDVLERFYGVLPAPPQDAFGLYVWKVLAFQATPRRRDSAFTALRKIPAMTPDSLARAPRGKIEAAVARAGSLRDERLRALTAGASVFRRNPDLASTLRRPLAESRAALEALPHLRAADGEWMLLFAGDHPILPSDPRALRVLSRLDARAPSGAPAPDSSLDQVCADVARELDHDPARLRGAITYLAHHALATCTDRAPHCGVCPIVDRCVEGRARMAVSNEE